MMMKMTTAAPAVNTYWVADTLLSTWHLNCFNPHPTALRGRDGHYPYFTNENTEAPKVTQLVCIRAAIPTSPAWLRISILNHSGVLEIRDRICSGF